MKVNTIQEQWLDDFNSAQNLAADSLMNFFGIFRKRVNPEADVENHYDQDRRKP